MKKYKKFIKAAYNGELGLAMCQEWKQKIEKEFPKLFKKETLEVGKWYKQCGEIAFKESECGGYGFNSLGRWIFDSSWGFDEKEFNWVLATEQEVEEALIKEAKKRGFKNNIHINNGCLGFSFNRIINDGCGFIWDGEYLRIGNKKLAIFHNGKWAEIIQNTISREEAEKQLNAKIID